MTGLELNLQMNNKITKENITSFVYNIAEKYGIDNLINQLSFANNGNYYGLYEPNNLTLNINYELMNGDFSDLYKFNVNIINTIFHEMTHVVQIHQVYSDTTYKRLPTYYVLLIISYVISLNDYELYLNNHNTFILEYTADICSYINTLKILRRNNIEKEKIESYNQLFAAKIKKYYSNNSPINNANNLYGGFDLYKKIDSLNIDDEIKYKFRTALNNYGEENNLTEIEKLIYGYSTNERTLDELDNITTGKIKTLNLMTKIGD